MQKNLAKLTNTRLLLHALLFFFIGFVLAYLLQQNKIVSAQKEQKEYLAQSQKLFDIDQQMIGVDINAYQSLQHCYDFPKICNIFDPGGNADQLEAKSMQLMKEKQNIIIKYPSLIPKQYWNAWGIK